MEPFQVPQIGGGCGDGQVLVRGAVPGDLQPGGVGHGGDPEEFADPAAAGDVDLQAVDVRGHAVEVDQVEAVLPGRHVGQHVVADQAEAGQVVGADRFLVPADVEVGRGVGDPDRLLALVCAVRVDVQLDAVADGAAGGGHPGQIPPHLGAAGLADLDLHSGNALLMRPAGELAVLLLVVVGGEAAAAVHRHLSTGGADQPGQRQVVPAGLEVPDRAVGGGEGEPGDTGTPGVA